MSVSLSLVILFKCQFCSTVLHPQHKLKYFRDANWDDAWVATATAIVRDEFVRAYADRSVDDVVVVSAKSVCISPISLSPLKLTDIFSLLNPPSGISSIICHRSLPLSRPGSRMSLNNTLSVLLRMLRIPLHGGPRTVRFIPVYLKWR